ncbi:MAG: protein-disulfide reductase DsbD domain-containing protein [Pseudomonadota bacterium]
MILGLLAALLGGISAAQAQQPWMQLDQVIEIDILPGWRQDDGTHLAGLKVQLAPGWVTYWRSAGAAGISPRMDWQGSDNVTRVDPVWPRPKVFKSDIGQSIGYDRDFVLPLRIRPVSDGIVRLHGTLDIGVCQDICLPAKLEVTAELPAGGVPDIEIEAALADQPERVDQSVTCVLRPTSDGFALAGQIDVPSVGYDEAVVFELSDPSVWVTDAVVARQGDQLIATSELMVGGDRRPDIDRSEVRITIIGETRAVEILGCAE